MAKISSEQLDEAVAGQTVPLRFLRTVADHGDRVALRTRDGDGWAELTYAEYAARVATVTSALGALGVGPGDRVVLMMRNIVDFHIVDLALLFRGATPISIYNSSSSEQIAYVVGHCGASMAIVEDDGFLSRFVEARDRLPTLRTIVRLAEDGSPLPDGVLGRSALFDGHDPVDLDAAAASLSPESLVTVIYTSGTTGPPKGVMLTHHNVLWTAESLLQVLGIDPVGLRAVSYLPMAHIAERMATHYLGLLGGLEVTTCPDPGQIAAYAREVRPQLMFGVPRVWEKIHAGVQAALAADPEKKRQFDEGVAAAAPIADRRAWGTATEEDEATWAFLDEVAFRGVRELIGLDALQFAISGAAAIAPDLVRWYRAIGVPFSEIYGMSESTALIAWEPTKVKPGTVGVPFPGMEVFLAEDGEVCCRGGNVFTGYLDDPEKTAEARDADGTLHTGDIGTFDEDGYLRIIDRKKELIITAGGKNISPANLETALKTIPLVAQACTIGDGRPFVAALVTLDPEVAPAWAKERGLDATTIEELSSHPEVVAEVERGVAEVMAPFNNAERVKKVRILPDEWLPDSNEMTPTSKLKRRGIHERYAADIEALYG